MSLRPAIGLKYIVAAVRERADPPRSSDGLNARTSTGECKCLCVRLFLHGRLYACAHVEVGKYIVCCSLKEGARIRGKSGCRKVLLSQTNNRKNKCVRVCLYCIYTRGAGRANGRAGERAGERAGWGQRSRRRARP
eukprot:476914-Pleurochrysis_carterae.AAC.1